MASHREIEVKLRTDPAKIAKIRRSQWWRGLERLHRQSLHSIYYDTSDHRLRDCQHQPAHPDRRPFVRADAENAERGIGLGHPLRMGNGRSGPHSRSEPGHRSGVAGRFPQAHVGGPAAGVRRRGQAGNAPPGAGRRADRRLAGPGRGDRWAKTREPVHEIELELVSGELPALFAEARRIADLVEGRLHTRTKADIGYALGDSERRHWSRAAKLSLTPEMTAGDSLHLIVLNSFSHLTANDDCARLNLHIEGVHQCRIALRRLRSAFKIYRPLLRRKRIAPIDEEVRWLGRILGAARDLDVLQTELLEPAIAALGEEKQLAPLMVTLAARKAEAYRGVAEALESARYRHLLIELCALGHADDLSKSGEGPGLDQPLLELASAALTRAHERLLKRGRGFEQLSKPERHDVRIALKRLRYALDFFSDIFDSEQKKKFVKKLTRLQDDLGRMNDVAVAETMLARLVGVVRRWRDAGRRRPIRTTGVCGRRRARLASPARGRDGCQPDQGLEVVRAGEAVLARARRDAIGVEASQSARRYPSRTRSANGCGGPPIDPQPPSRNGNAARFSDRPQACRAVAPACP